MQVAFRMEGSTQIGMGHVSRCLTLAAALQQRGATVSFFCGAYTGHYILTQQPDAVVLNVPDLSPAEDAHHCRKLFASPPDWLVVDHYALGRDWETSMRPHVGRIMAIDDLSRAHDCDLLLDQNYLPQADTRYAGKLPDGCQMLLGPAYALLRPAIAQSRTTQPWPRRDGPVLRVFICFGGGDAPNKTLMALEAAASFAPRLAIDVVAGAAHPALDQLTDAARSWPQVTLFTSHPAPEQLMAKADLAIGAGGTMMLERCALRLPSLVVSIADNQRPSCRYMATQGMIRYLGHGDAVDRHVIEKALGEWITDPEPRHRMAARCGNLVDGLGTGRVVQIMEEQ